MASSEPVALAPTSDITASVAALSLSHTHTDVTHPHTAAGAHTHTDTETHAAADAGAAAPAAEPAALERIIPDTHKGPAIEAALERVRAWRDAYIRDHTHTHTHTDAHSHTHTHGHTHAHAHAHGHGHGHGHAAAPALTESDVAFLRDDSVLRRYVVARDGNVAAVAESLVATLGWRKTNIDTGFFCPACETDRYAHCFIPLGWDELGRPVVYTSQARATCFEVEVSMQHVARGIEKLFAHPRTRHVQWVWIADFNGFGFKHAMQARMGITAVTTFSHHLPERLGKMLWLNPPGIFNTFMAALHPFVDKRTMDKLHSVSAHGDALHTALRANHLPEELARWIVQAVSMKPTSGNLPPLMPDSPSMLLQHRRDGSTLSPVDPPKEGAAK